ncbi:MAG: hypothetical protein KY397_03175 [Gemmatimonadetes bacterium]|nr:hypothetical protein [Gemmatimonadota bacterium]
MQSKIGAGIVAGLVGGVVFGIMMTMMMAPTPEGGEMPMMAMVANVVRSDSLAVGWVYHLFNSAVIGAIFGWVLGSAGMGYGGGLVKGLLYGVFWWILGAQILMPLFLGMPVFASLRMPPMRMVAVGSLMGHILFGLILGATFVALYRETRTAEAIRARGTIVPFGGRHE